MPVLINLEVYLTNLLDASQLNQVDNLNELLRVRKEILLALQTWNNPILEQETYISWKLAKNSSQASPGERIRGIKVL